MQNVNVDCTVFSYFAQCLVHITRTILSIDHMQNENQRRLGQSLFILFLALRHSIQIALIPIFTLKIKGYSLQRRLESFKFVLHPLPTGTIVPSSKVTSAEGSGPVLPQPENKMFLFSAVNVSTTQEGSISPPEACIIPFGQKKENVELKLVNRNCNWCKLLDQCQARNKMHATLRAGKDAAGVSRVRGCKLV